MISAYKISLSKISPSRWVLQKDVGKSPGLYMFSRWVYCENHKAISSDTTWDQSFQLSKRGAEQSQGDDWVRLTEPQERNDHRVYVHYIQLRVVPEKKATSISWTQSSALKQQAIL